MQLVLSGIGSGQQLISNALQFQNAAEQQ